MSIISERRNIIKRNHMPIDGSNCPPIEECTSFGDTNNNKLDIAIDDINQRMITLNGDNKSICIDRTV